METWNEIGGAWKVIATVLIILGPSALAVGLKVLLIEKRQLIANACVAAVTLSFLWAFVLFMTTAAGISRQTWYEPPKGFKLAVVEKNTTRIVAYNLKLATLRPWPLPTAHRVVEYPAQFVFFSNLQPITKNPKVVPLIVQVTVVIPKDANPLFLADYILNQQRQQMDEKTFKRYAFNLLQHKLPQEIADQLNPFDEASMAAFKEFVAKELNPYLVQHKVDDVTVALK